MTDGQKGIVILFAFYTESFLFHFHEKKSKVKERRTHEIYIKEMNMFELFIFMVYEFRKRISAIVE